MIEYKVFIETLNKRIKLGTDFYVNLLEKIVSEPSRYSGVFRLSNAKTKIIQNVTQSNEIKFGDFMEEIVTDYIGLHGYNNLKKRLISEGGNDLNVDQLFENDYNIFLVEQKIRDDHDSTKKRGQFENFLKKIEFIKKQSNKKIIAIMWFIDDSKTKNKNYYLEQMESHKFSSIEMKLFYGADFFDFLNNAHESWEELINHLIRYRDEQSKDVLEIPDFDTSDEVLEALVKLNDTYWKKLNSKTQQFELLRNELFPTKHNLEKAKLIRKSQ
jgi:hypothetical protein